MKTTSSEPYVCVDVETAGPIPADYSLLSLGACTIFEPQRTFYIELKPINDQLTAEAAAVHHLSLPRLMTEGVAPAQALARFDTWLLEEASPGRQPLFVAFNAAFDWMFINYYFIHYLGRNPFGYTAIDIKAFYMGQAGVPWSHTSWRYIDPSSPAEPALTHHALQDALDQAALFRKLINKSHVKTTSLGDDQP